MYQTYAVVKFAASGLTGVAYDRGVGFETSGVTDLGGGYYGAAVSFSGPRALIWRDGQPSPSYAAQALNPPITTVAPFSRYCVADFGPGYAGLATVGYRVDLGARVSAGVVDLGNGAYGATVSFSAPGSVLWDTGAAPLAWRAEALNPPQGAWDGVSSPEEEDFQAALTKWADASVAFKASFPGGLRDAHGSSMIGYPFVRVEYFDPEPGESADDATHEIIAACYGAEDAGARRAAKEFRGLLLKTADRSMLVFSRDGRAWRECGVMPVQTGKLAPAIRLDDGVTLWRHEHRYRFFVVGL